MSDVQLRRILIVEDDMPFSQMLQTLLERNGFAPDVARDGIEALEKLSAVSYQVVLLDYIIPKLTGLDLLRKLSHRQDMPPFVVLTGKGNESVAVEMMKLGPFGIYFDPLATKILGLRPLSLKKKNRSLMVSSAV